MKPAKICRLAWSFFWLEVIFLIAVLITPVLFIGAMIFRIDQAFKDPKSYFKRLGKIISLPMEYRRKTDIYRLR